MPAAFDMKSMLRGDGFRELGGGFWQVFEAQLELNHDPSAWFFFLSGCWPNVLAVILRLC